VTVGWIEAVLKGQKVFARADESGKLVAEGGRVEIRYKPGDSKSYRAGQSNLQVTGTSVLPDSHCSAEAAPAPSAYEQKKQKKAASAERFERETQPAKDGEFIAYTDGACSGNPGPAGSGFVVIEPGGKIHEGFEYLGVGTNNVAELTAVLRGVEAILDAAAHARVYTDSSYAIGVLQKGWKAKANQELIAKIRAELARRPNVRLHYVPGHANVPMNERADELAREAVTSRRSKPIVLA
jgi:ribonuclease HI